SPPALPKVRLPRRGPAASTAPCVECPDPPQRTHRIGTYAFSMEPAGAERLRGFRAPGADVAAGSASSPAQGQPERSESARCRRRIEAISSPDLATAGAG